MTTEFCEVWYRTLKGDTGYYLKKKFWYKVDRKVVFLNKKKYFPKVTLLVLSGHVSKLQGLVLTFYSKVFQTESHHSLHTYFHKFSRQNPSVFMCSVTLAEIQYHNVLMISHVLDISFINAFPFYWQDWGCINSQKQSSFPPAFQLWGHFSCNSFIIYPTLQELQLN